MKPLITCVVFLFLARLLAAEREPTGGLADLVLRSSDMGGNWTCQMQMLFDPQANPTEAFQVATNFSRRHSLSPGEVENSVRKQRGEKRDFFRRSLAGLGADAQVILQYYDSNNKRRYSMTIYRYKTVEGVDDMWRRRGESPEFRVARIAQEEVIYTRAGQTFPGDLVASQPSVEEREGTYHVMVSPGKPERDDPGLSLLRKQIAKLRTRTEPGIAPNGGRASSVGNPGASERPPSVN